MTAQPAYDVPIDDTPWVQPPHAAAAVPASRRGPNPVLDLCLRTADLNGYRRQQRQRTLGAAIWLSLGASLVLGAVNLLTHDWQTALSLLTAAGLFSLILWSRRRLGARLTGGLVCVLLLVAVTVINLYGHGIHDIGIIAYPVLVVFGGSILGKRSVLHLTAGCYLSLAVIALAGLSGRFDELHAIEVDDLVAFTVVLGAAGVLVWISMDNLERNFERIRSAEAKGQLAYERTLEAWSRALEYRDRETDGHSRRVTDLTVRLARELGIGEPELTRLRWGALLHDIGKLAIPDRILLKPGPLSEEERELMELHPVYARNMLAEIPFLNTLDDIPYHHHERWDGSGYPQGLRGEEIPLAARIFAIVDVWEALSSRRPYREAWSRERILAFMRSGSGTSFDPAILEVFLERVAPQLTSPSA